MDRVLFYGTGGLAYGDIKTGLTGGTLTSPNTSTNSATGWTAGLGAEFVLAGNWTTKFEYLCVDLGNSTC